MMPLPTTLIVVFDPKVAAHSPAVAAVQAACAKALGDVVWGDGTSVCEVLPAAPGGLPPVELHCAIDALQANAQAALIACVAALPHVAQVAQATARTRKLGRHAPPLQPFSFTYNGVTFGPETFHLFAGLCTVDTPQHVDQTFRALAAQGLTTTRAGAFKPRTSCYDFQGHGAACLPYVFELAGKHGIKVVAMEVMAPAHVDAIAAALEQSGHPTGVMLQIGTRNAQNFELLRYVGAQDAYPILYKRGMGNTLQEALHACEYILHAGNRRVVLCLRGVKSILGEPHRNLADVTHVPAVSRLTRLPVCIDPSHTLGPRERAGDGLLEVMHLTAQGIIAGAQMALIDVHPKPEVALCDGPQALLLEELPHLVQDCALVRRAYLARVELGAADGLQAVRAQPIHAAMGPKDAPLQAPSARSLSVSQRA